MHWRQIQRMVCDNFCKLLQRQTYTFLSSKHGMLVCFAALLLVCISLVQFGEVALEWSVARYQKTLFPYVDNILHTSFRDRLCLPLPIDIVYTWVNGTDPRLLKQLAQLKSEIELRLNETSTETYENIRETTRRGKGTSKGVGNTASEGCPYKNCIALNTLVLKVHTIIQPADLRKVDPVFNNALSVYNVSVKTGLKSDSRKARLTVVKFANEDTLKRAIDRSYHINNEKVVAQRAYLTSQSAELAVRMRAMALVSAKNLVYEADDFKSFLQQQFARKLRALDHYAREKIAVLTFTNDKTYQDAIRLKKGDVKFQGVSLVFEPVLMVWEPFSNVDLEKRDNHFSASRFADNQELRYSLRSVEKFAPWVRQIFIVTNGQIPSWLNLDNPRIKIITHADIFTNKSHLPTFSSPAIESHLHNIPGLSKKFIYMNDDVMFGAEVWPDNFYTHAKGQKVFLSWPVPNCNEGCPSTWINDKYCDKACNFSECDWDGGDCLNSNIKIPNKWQDVISSMKKTRQVEFCNTGCADSWIGDRYCDGACNHPACGLDAGDCGVNQFSGLYSVTLQEDSKSFSLPSGLRAMFFNLSKVYGEGRVTEGEQDGSSILRSVTIAQKFKVMVLTFYPNETLTTVKFRLAGFRKLNDTKLTELKFNVTIETMTKVKNEIIRTSRKTLASHSNSTELPDAIPSTLYPIRIYNANDSLNYWNAGDSRMAVPTWPKVDQSEYCVPEIPAGVNIPEDILKKFLQLDEDLKLGDITEKGYNRKKAKLIKERLALTCDLIRQTTVKPEMAYMKSMTKAFPEPSHSETTARLSTVVKKSIESPSHFSTRRLNHYDETKRGFLPWERQQVFQKLLDRKKQQIVEESYTSTSHRTRSLLDAFSGSLLHVNRIYNRAFGYKTRKVPAHMPHMIDVDVMNELHARFPEDFDVTSSHKLRSENDMQFALSYFYFVIDQTKEFNVSLVFKEIDADSSGTLSDRELRTLLTKFNEIPLKPKTIRTFIKQLWNCSRTLDNNTNTVRSPTSAVRPQSERHYGYDVPLVTETLLRHCEAIVKQLNISQKKESKYKHEVVGEEDVAFKMIKNNATHVLKQLDEIRKKKKKFICLNDNIEHDKVNASVVKGILVDFYETLFPTASQFELPENVRNQFLYVDELNSWKNRKKRMDIISDSLLMVILIVLLAYLCWSPLIYLIRRVVGFIRRRVRTSRTTNPTSTRLLTV